MSVAVVMPKLGDVMETGLVSRWLKQDNDWVERGEPLFEAESDKVSLVIDAVADGYLRQITREGVEVGVGDVLGLLLTRDEAANAARRQGTAKVEPEA